MYFRKWANEEATYAIGNEQPSPPSPPYLTAIFNYNVVIFGGLAANSHDNPAPNQLAGTYNVTVDTNANYNVSASGTQFSDGAGHTFAVSNLKMDTNSTAANLANTTAVTLSGSLQSIDIYGSSVTTNYHGYWLSIPALQYAAAYNSTVTVEYATVA